ncbi:MAG: Ribonuclease [Verrucomicrobiales bacterium]|nr:Ribonuclease [Verrucomicrobiales bacterium]
MVEIKGSTNYAGQLIVNPLTSYTTKLTAEQGESLRKYLDEKGFEFKQVPYAKFGAGLNNVNVVMYDSMKLVVQGKGTSEFLEFVLEPQILQQASLGYEEALHPELLDPRIGVDESGKGDFFGPLCVAGVYVNAEAIQSWKNKGIQDSKNISSDKRMAELAELILNTKGAVVSVVPVGCAAYNKLYTTMRSVNTILAWGHARVIENLLRRKEDLKPAPLRAISDQFASSKSVIEKALMKEGKSIELVQRHKAEADIAVAAASIVARNEFVTRLRQMGKEFGMTFPKGASAAVDEAAKIFVEKFGQNQLEVVAKCHFRNAYRAKGLTEPPKVEWKKSKSQ